MSTSVTFINNAKDIGGPGTFQINFTKYCEEHDIKVFLRTEYHKPQNILVISGTRRILYLLKCKFLHRAKIIQRLDGFEFLSFEITNLARYIKNKMQYFLIMFIMLALADTVIYQSKFVKNWWNGRLFGYTPKNSNVILNGYNPIFDVCKKRSSDKSLRFFAVEGAVKVDLYTRCILRAIDTVLQKRKKHEVLRVYGKLEGQLNEDYTNIVFTGHINRSEVAELYSDGRPIFLLLEREAACPNSLIEAVGAGVPSIGGNDGSFAEITCDSGLSFNHGLVVSDNESFTKQMQLLVSQIDENYAYFMNAALLRSKKLKLKNMMSQYIKLLETS